MLLALKIASPTQKKQCKQDENGVKIDGMLLEPLPELSDLLHLGLCLYDHAQLARRQLFHERQSRLGLQQQAEH